MIEFTPREDCSYKFNYVQIFKDIALKALPEQDTLRTLCLNDLFFILHFVLQISPANHPFVVEACKEVEDGKDDWQMDLWARGHFKSTTITTASLIQTLLKEPESRICIFSHTRPAAKAFLRNVKIIFETSELLKRCFPEILWNDPKTQAPKWSEDDGLYIKRTGFYPEASLEAWGLIEGMPTGKHYTHRFYDDIETMDIVKNPDQIDKLRQSFAMSQNLKSFGGKHRIVGTPYSHLGLLQQCRDLKTPTGEPVYILRCKPATSNGEIDGSPVLLSQKELDSLKSDLEAFNSQQLLDPTPSSTRHLKGDLIKEIRPDFIPTDVFKFMVIDNAGDEKNREGCSWAVLTVAVEPKLDNLGASNIYITDALIEPLKEQEAPDLIARMYLRAGMVMALGVEKVGMSTTEVHIANSLRVHGKHLSLEAGNLILLKPAGRKKELRIESALAWPLFNGNIHISTSIPLIYRDRLRQEMDKFPAWKLDGIDALSYIYDILRTYQFPSQKNAFSKPYTMVEEYT